MRVWMVTGAGRGLGRAFVQEAVNKGDGVIAAVRKHLRRTGKFF